MDREHGRRRSLLADLPGVTIVVDAAGVIEWAEESVASLLDWCPGDLVGRRVQALLPEWSTAESANGADAPAVVRLPAKRRGGGTLPVVVIAGPISDRGRCLLINPARGEGHDAAARSGDGALDRDLDAATEVRRGVDQAIHELRNLLGVIRNYAALLTRELSEDNALADLAQIETAARQSSELVADLAELAEGRMR